LFYPRQAVVYNGLSIPSQELFSFILNTSGQTRSARRGGDKLPDHPQPVNTFSSLYRLFFTDPTKAPQLRTVRRTPACATDTVMSG
ncbi:MAG: hypothetical protein OEV73_13330, partial [Desulfobulbaceae bacterium]|nr:hypothetical protein [Desulfobulbaceae bacterium]